jgi:ribosomal protein S18 acetylase RimI-like enzyme
VLHVSTGLTEPALTEIAKLEQRVVEADGGRLKLEWGVLRSRDADQQRDLLWWDGDRLMGFLGLYSFGAGQVELAGMVDPQARRRGIGAALLTRGTELCRELELGRALLIVPRQSEAGQALARSVGATLDHSEYALALEDEPTPGEDVHELRLRAATVADLLDMTRLMTTAFAWEPPDLQDRLRADLASTVVIERDARTVGSLRLNRHGEVAGVYGFAVEPELQGQGIGRQALRSACRQARADGVRRVELEVAVENDHALGLYTSLGFQPVTTEDYFILQL